MHTHHTRVATKRRTGRYFATAVIGLTMVLSACGGGGQANDIRTVAPRTLPLDAAMPAPHGAPTLIVRGEGLDTNDNAGGVSIDLATLGRLRTVEARIHDPWEKRDVSYRGVLMSDFLTAVGVPAGATEVAMTALDDYQATLDVAELRSGRVLLATHADGAPMAVKDGGPSRIIFLPDSKVGQNKDLWIWSLREMTVR